MPANEALRQRVADVLTRDIAPALSLDGAQLEVLEVADGIARIRLGGVCGNCPSTIMAVIHGLEQEIRRLVPEVEYVEGTP